MTVRPNLEGRTATAGSGHDSGGEDATLRGVLRRHRVAAGLTQEELAERAGVSVRTVSDLERGTHTSARRSTIDGLARGLGLSPAQAVRLHAVRRGDISEPSPEPVRTVPGRLPFVGREPARDRFRDGWERLRAGERLAVLYVGEAGIGKSRLLDELVSEARSSGAIVLAGRCDELVRAPYRVLVEAIRSGLSGRALSDALGAIGPAADALGFVAPQLAGPTSMPPGPHDPDATRALLLDAVTNLIGAIGVTEPVVLAIDDLQAADPSTLGVLRHLLRADVADPLLLLAAYRDGEVAPGDPLESLLAELHRDRRVITAELAGLDHAALASLVRHELERIDPGLVDRLARHTGGNPFFVEEVLSDLSERDVDLASGLATVPDGARTVVRARLRRLSPAAIRALETASIVGRSFDIRLFEHVAETLATEGLDEAVAAGFLELRVGTLAFRHDIVRGVVVDDVGRVDAARIHWRTGDALAHIHAADHAGHEADIAHHLARGATAGDPARASEALLGLGTQQFQALALDEAVVSLTDALALSPSDEEGTLRRMKVLELLAETHFWRDDPDPMRAAALGAADQARRHGSPEDLARTVVVAARWNRGGELDTGILDLIDEAIERIGPGDSTWHSQLMSMRAYVLQGAARGFDTQSVVARSEAMARRVGNTEALVMALTVQTYTHVGSPDLARLRRVVDELQATVGRVERQDHRQHFLVFALRARAQVQLAGGDRAGFAATRAELEAVTTHMRARFVPGQLRYWDATLAAAEGRFDEATRLSAEALETWDTRPDAQRAHLVQTANVLVERGELDVVIAQVEGLAAGNASTAGFAWRALMAAALATTGRAAEARSWLVELAADRFGALAFDHHRPLAMRWLSELVASAGTRDDADALLPLLSPYGGQVLLGAAIGTVEGAADRGIGQLLALLGRAEEATDHFSRAVALEERLGFEALATRSRYWWARAEITGGTRSDRRTAGQRAERVTSDAARLGMARLAADARELANRAR